MIDERMISIGTQLEADALVAERLAGEPIPYAEELLKSIDLPISKSAYSKAVKKLKMTRRYHEAMVAGDNPEHAKAARDRLSEWSEYWQNRVAEELQKRAHVDKQHSNRMKREKERDRQARKKAKVIAPPIVEEAVREAPVKPVVTIKKRRTLSLRG